MTKSEAAFLKYLDAYQYDNWVRVAEGALKQPDYAVTWRNTEVIFEIKEFSPKKPPRGFGGFDPYPPIRRKLSKAAKQFKLYRDRPCCVVLFNDANGLVRLDHQTISGAMFGNLGFTMPVGGTLADVRTEFLRGGKLLLGGQPLNQTISAVVVLRDSSFSGVALRVRLREHEESSRRYASMEEARRLASEVRDSVQPSVLVLDNPFAANPLSTEWFQNLYDERYGCVGAAFCRTFVGPALAELEGIEAAQSRRLWLCEISTKSNAINSAVDLSQSDVYEVKGLPVGERVLIAKVGAYWRLVSVAGDAKRWAMQGCDTAESALALAQAQHERGAERIG